ncbi:MAG: ABC transporter permease [Flavobacteriaceae bacterium]|nr:ABC transporter permease [Flavobacteriaceae bacterium]
MIKNWLQIFIRNLKQRPLYPIVNVFGITIGVTCFLLVMLYVSFELRYEQWVPNKTAIYRPISVWDSGDVWATHPRILAVKAKEAFPEVEDVLISNFGGSHLVHYQEETIQRTSMVVTENFFQFFPYPFVYGNADKVLQKHNTLILSNAFAKELFGEMNPVGKVIRLDKEDMYTVEGVYEKEKFPSQFQQDIIRLIDKFDEQDQTWGNYNYEVLYKLQVTTDLKSFEKKFNDFFDKYVALEDGETLEAYLKQKENTFVFEQLDQLYLFSRVHQGRGATTVIILSLIGVLLLFISAINFVNLSIAGSILRAKEVAMRKTLGASKQQLVAQFVLEVFLQCLIALFMALMLVEILLPPFNTLMDTEVSLNANYNHWGFAILVFVVTLLLAGLLPALYLSNFKAIKVLKGNFGRSKNGQQLKKSMLLVQFIISAVFLICAIVIQKQLRFMQQKDLGFSKEQIMMVSIQQPESTWRKFNTYKQELKQLEGVRAVTTTNRPPGVYANQGANTGVRYMQKDMQADIHFVDARFFEVMGIYINQGKTFKKDWFVKDEDKIIKEGDYYKFENQILVNKQFLNNLEINDPIGKFIDYWEFKGEIIGVVDDYLAKGFDKEILPAIFMNYNNDDSYWVKPNFVLLKLDPSKISEVIPKVELFWTANIEKEHPFQYEFLDENFAKLYQKQSRLQKLVTILSGLMIVIALLGLFAVASYSIRSRFKEVAIRKTLGASDNQLIFSLLKEFLWITIIAIAAALPIGYWLSERWLSDFVYRISIPWMAFVLSPILILLCTGAIILMQSMKALRIDMVKQLKYE